MTLEIELKITKDSLDNLTWGDWEALQDGNIGYKEARRLIAVFMVNPDGTPVPFDDAMETLKQLKTGEMRAMVENFTKAMTKTAGELVPNAKGSD